MSLEIVIAIVVGILILGGLALWKGTGLTIGREGNRMKLKIDAAEKEAEQNVSVGEKLKLQDVDAGDVVGVRSDEAAATKQDVDVLREGDLKGGRVGDIIGVDRSKGRTDTGE